MARDPATRRDRDPGSSPLILLGAGLFAGTVGWLLGGWAICSLDLAEALCRQEGQSRTIPFPLTRDLNRLTGSIRAAVERSMVRERLLQEKRAALARSRDRLRAIRSLSGSTCWEIDLATGRSSGRIAKTSRAGPRWSGSATSRRSSLMSSRRIGR